jgi:hypothetical protein
VSLGSITDLCSRLKQVTKSEENYGAMGLQSVYPLLTPVLTSPYRHCSTARSCNLIISYQFDVPLVVCPLRWFFCLLGCGSCILIPCIPPCLGALVYL